MAKFGFNRTTLRATQPKLYSMFGAVFEDRIIMRRTDVVWPLRSCNLTPLGYYLWGAVNNKCYADKPETTKALKDNIHETIGEIPLHTIDMLLHGQPRRLDTAGLLFVGCRQR